MPLTTLGKYELLEELGQGGFGTVYRARETSLEITRAVKVLHPTLMTASDFIDRFRREGKTTAQLDHPHIVPIYELGEEQGYYYLTMKYMPGGSLKDWLERQGRLPFAQAVEILQQMAQALEYALEQPDQLIHRDIKPGNILFERQPDDPKGVWVRLSDFGFAKALLGGESSSFSASGGIKGTPAYIAPEIWDDQPASPASDQYSLACVFYEMLTGQVLFSGSTPMALMKNVAAGPKFPETWPPGVPREVSQVLRRALAAELGERYTSATDFSFACAGLPSDEQKAELERQAAEQAAREAEAQASLEKTQRDAAEKVNREHVERESAAREAQENAQRQSEAKAAKDATLSGEQALLFVSQTEPKYLPDSEADVKPQQLEGEKELMLVSDGHTVASTTVGATQKKSTVVWKKRSFSSWAIVIIILSVIGGFVGLLGVTGFLGVFLFSTPALHPTITPMPTWTGSMQQTVQAKGGWTDTGVFVTNGQNLYITYLSGMWSPCAPPYGCPFSDANGDPTAGGDENTSLTYVDNIISGCYHGALIAQIGSNTPFCVSSSYSEVANQTGELRLSINDYYISDAGGEIIVKVDVGINK